MKSENPLQWLDSTSMASVLGISLSNFERHIRPYVEAEHVRKTGRKLLFHAPSVISMREKKRVRKAGAKPAQGDLTWLERFRRERTLLSQLEREAREGNLLRREEVHEHLGHLAQILRNAGEVLKRQFGPEAQDVLNEALDEFERRIKVFEKANKGLDRNQKV